MKPLKPYSHANAGLAALVIGTAAAGQSSADDIISDLLLLSERSNAALMQGDYTTYTSLLKLSDDFSLMSPFGGEPSFGPEYTPERIERMAAFFRNGQLSTETVATYASDDMVVIAYIERIHVEVGGLPAQDWDLRVTLVYRRAGETWELVHRHADPLVAALSLDQAAELGRGERKPEAD